MKKILFTIVLCTVATSLQARGFGVGIVAGAPTGLSMKAWSQKSVAWDAAMAWSLNSDYLYVHIDRLQHDFSAIRLNELRGKLGLNYGLGAAFIADNSPRNSFNGLGARVPLGLNYLFSSNPLEVFAEMSAILMVVPETDLLIEPAIGARYYLN